MAKDNPMKAFLIGLLSILAVALIAGIGYLLWPVFFVLAIILRTILAIVLAIFVVWLLGKFILFIWEKLNPPDDSAPNDQP